MERPSEEIQYNQPKIIVFVIGEKRQKNMTRKAEGRERKAGGKRLCKTL